jgi:predicted RNase H-like HicB family nuclease
VLEGASGINVLVGQRVVVHEADEGGYWAEVPSLPGCATQGENLEELMANICEAIEACLAVELM